MCTYVLLHLLVCCTLILSIVRNSTMSCLHRITELQQQQSKTLELYKDLYESFIAPQTPAKAKNRLVVNLVLSYCSH